MRSTRRRFLRNIAWMTTAAAFPGEHAKHAPAAGESAKLMDTSALARFVDPLPIPALAKSVGLRPSPADPSLQIPYYRIGMRQFQRKVHRDVPPTTFWGYDGSCPGPTFETRRGKADPRGMGKRVAAATSLLYRPHTARCGSRQARRSNRRSPSWRKDAAGKRRLSRRLVRPRKICHVLLPESAGSCRALLSRSCDGYHPAERRGRPVRALSDSRRV